MYSYRVFYHRTVSDGHNVGSRSELDSRACGHKIPSRQWIIQQARNLAALATTRTGHGKASAAALLPIKRVCIPRIEPLTCGLLSRPAAGDVVYSEPDNAGRNWIFFFFWPFVWDYSHGVATSFCGVVIIMLSMSRVGWKRKVGTKFISQAIAGNRGGRPGEQGVRVWALCQGDNGTHTLESEAAHCLGGS